MRNLDRALLDIAMMRSQLARSTVFRGYGPATLAATGILAWLSAVLQAVYLPIPAAHPMGYLALWMGTAALSVVIIGSETITRSRRVHSGLADAMIRLAIEQFLPAAVAGVLLTLVMVRCAPEALWLLPGLWQIILSLGVFASCRSVPRLLAAVGVWYMGTGFLCLILAGGDAAFSPLAMGLPFGFGQFLAAGLLQYSGASDDEA